MKNRKSVVQAVLFHFILRAGGQMVFMVFVCTALVTNRSWSMTSPLKHRHNTVIHYSQRAEEKWGPQIQHETSKWGNEGINYVSAVLIMLLQSSCFPLREESAGKAERILSASSDKKRMSPHPRPHQALFFSPFPSQEDLTLCLILGWCLSLKGARCWLSHREVGSWFPAPPPWASAPPGARSKQGAPPARHPAGALSRRGAAFSFAICSNQSFLIICASLP